MHSKRRSALHWFRCGCSNEPIEPSVLKESGHPSFDATTKEEVHIYEYAHSEHFVSEASFYSAVDPSSAYDAYIPGRYAHKCSRRLASGVLCDPSLTERPSWARVNADRFFVRVGPNYAKLGLKQPSDLALYEPIGLDILRNDFRIVSKALGKQQFPTPPPYYPQGFCPLPALIALNAQLPLHGPSVFHKADPGISVVAYFMIKESTVEALSQLQTSGVQSAQSGHGLPAAIRQIQRLVDRGYSDKTLALKAIAQVRDWDKHRIPMSGVLKKYNGKPGTITGSATFIRDKIPYDHLEVDFDIRKWNILARTAFPSLKDKLKELTLDVACVVEATADEDLPERVLGCMTIHGIDWALAEDFDATPRD